MNFFIRENTLTADDYLLVESKMGESLTSKEQAERSIAHQLYSVTAYLNKEIIGIARLLGDSSIFFYINDVWVLPEYQGKGLGKTLVEWIIRHIKDSCIPGTSVSVCLMSAKRKEGFYEKLGFKQRPHDWEGAGMEMELDIE